MSVTAAQPSPLTFERFWRWLLEHNNCVLRVGAPDATLFDHEDLHWDFFEDDEGVAVIQLVRGKVLVGELLVEKSKVALVQPQVDPENAQNGHWTFEVIGADQSGFRGVYFLMAHGLDSPQGHAELKH
jgi:hypothetical protein